MSKSLTIFFSPNRLHIEVENGISRTTVGEPLKCLKAMDVDDFGVLVAFCRAVVDVADNPQGASMFLVKETK